MKKFCDCGGEIYHTKIINVTENNSSIETGMCSKCYRFYQVEIQDSKNKKSWLKESYDDFE